MIRGHTRGTCSINDLLYLPWGTAKEHARQACLHGDLTVDDLGTDFTNRALESLSGEELTKMLTVGTGGGNATALLSFFFFFSRLFAPAVKSLSSAY